jgi:hypothetical protein
MTNGLWQFLDICGKAITKLSITFILSLLFHSRMIWEVFGTRKYRTFYRCFLPNLRLALRFQRRRLKCEKLTDAGRQVMAKDHVAFGKAYLLTPPPLRGSLPRKSLIFRMDWVSCAGDINLPHTPFPPARSPPNKKIKYNKILTYILRSIFLEIPYLELPHWQKRREIRMVKVFNDIRLLICLTPLQVNWVMEIN